MISTQTLTLALVAVILLGAVLVTGRKLSERRAEYIKSRNELLRSGKSTHFLDASLVDDSCEICFGKFEEGDVAVCKCGRTFHRECAEMTEECPYCKAKYDTMAFREIRVPRCAACGRALSGNVCKCGNVMPRKDMSFECICGETLYSRDRICPKCGAKYGFTFRRPGY